MKQIALGHYPKTIKNMQHRLSIHHTILMQLQNAGKKTDMETNQIHRVSNPIVYYKPVNPLLK